MDYALPRADDLPPLDITLAELPTAANPLGVKGAGQAGCIAAPQTIVNAILDALAPLGIDAYRHAGHPRAGLARDPRRPPEPGPDRSGVDLNMIGAPLGDDCLTLYGSFTSISSYKPMLYPALAGLPFSFRTVNLKTGVQNTPEYLAINRWGVVPSLRHRGL